MARQQRRRSSPDQVEKKPLEQLVEANERVGKTRKKAAKPRDPTAKVERFYRAQLKSLVRRVNKVVEEEVLPVVKQEKAEYQADSAYTRDNWAERVTAALRAVLNQFVGGAFEEQYERLEGEATG